MAELRLAVTMTGGVSLAVWMGGVASEFLSFVRSTDPDLAEPRWNAYRRLLEISQLEPRIDVISGSSAGGINGALLAYAIANRVDSLKSVGRLWRDQGDILTLLRSVRESRPPSLLRGDEQFLPELNKAFSALSKRKRTSRTK